MDRTSESSCGAAFDGSDCAPTLHKPNGAPGYSDQELFAQKGAYLARDVAPEVCKTLSAEGFDGMPDLHKGNGQPVVACADMTHADEALREVKGGAAPTLQQRMGTGGNQVPVAFIASIDADKCKPSNADHQRKGGSGMGISEEDVAYTMQARNAIEKQNAVAVRTAQTSANGCGIADEAAHTLDRAQGQGVAVGFKAGQSANGGLGDEVEVCPTQSHEPSALEPTVAMRHIVRRLTPGECESLQGFPQGWTRIPWRGKTEEECPDSPRYRALGNSWACNCAEWVLRRIVAAMRLGIV